VRRREFITLVDVATTWPFTTRAREADRGGLADALAGPGEDGD